MTTYTSRGIPILEVSDAADIPARINPLAQFVHDRPGVSALTTTQRNGLAGVELWDGRLITNTTTDRVERYDLGLTTWTPIADFAEIAALLATTGTPAALGTTASRGVATNAARSDHVHAWPAMAAWTPTIGAGSGAFTTVSVVAARSIAFGKWREFSIHIDITTAGTATGNLTFTLPSNNINMRRAFTGVEDFSTGNSLSARGAVNSNVVIVTRYDGASIIANGRAILVSGGYEEA